MPGILVRRAPHRPLPQATTANWLINLGHVFGRDPVQSDVQSGTHGDGQLGFLVCMRDNVSVSPEDPQCPHPSSSCPFRELCEVRDAMRQKRRLARRSDTDVARRGDRALTEHKRG